MNDMFVAGPPSTEKMADCEPGGVGVLPKKATEVPASVCRSLISPPAHSEGCRNVPSNVKVRLA
jgi:hypothetical protein